MEMQFKIENLLDPHSLKNSHHTHTMATKRSQDDVIH